MSDVKFDPILGQLRERDEGSGPKGNDGADGRTILNGTVDPTTEGENGDFYLNTETLVLFGPKTGGSWGDGVLIKGADGADGAVGEFINKWEGVWSAGTYQEGQIVYHEGSSYVATTETSEEPGEGSDWEMVAQGGEGAGGGEPAGSDRQIQFNDDGGFGASEDFRLTPQGYIHVEGDDEMIVLGNTSGDARGERCVEIVPRRTNNNQVVSGSNNIGIGVGVRVRGGDGNVAIGSGNGFGNVAGPETSQSNTYGVAIGTATHVNGMGGIAIGKGAQVNSASGGVAVGEDSEVSAGNSIAIGRRAKATHIRSTALGADVETTENRQIRIGRSHSDKDSSLSQNSLNVPLWHTVIGFNTIASNYGVPVSPDESAVLQLEATDRGFLLPRLTETQRDAISDPATGLQIYNTDTDKINVYNGTEWEALVPESATYKEKTDTSAATLTPDAGARINRYNVTALDENATLAAPTGTAQRGDTLAIQITATDDVEITYNAVYVDGIAERETEVDDGETLFAVYTYNGSEWVLSGQFIA